MNLSGLAKAHPWLWFLGWQIVSIVLGAIGIPLIALLLAFRLTTSGTSLAGKPIRLFCGGKLTYLWNNDEDGIDNHGLANPFVWSALRNPVDNLKYISKNPSGPFYRKEWRIGIRRFYFQAGWNPWSHLIQCSGGAVTGPSWEWSSK